MEYAGFIIVTPEEFTLLAQSYERTSLMYSETVEYYQMKGYNPLHIQTYLGFSKEAYQKGALAFAIARRLEKRGTRLDECKTRGYAVLAKEMR